MTTTKPGRFFALDGYPSSHQPRPTEDNFDELTGNVLPFGASPTVHK